MTDHRIWTAVLTYCRNIPIDQTLIDKVKNLVKEEKNVIIFLKKEDDRFAPKHPVNEKWKALAEVFNDELAISKVMISTLPDVTEIIQIED